MDLIRNLLESVYNQETLPVAISKSEQIQRMKTVQSHLTDSLARNTHLINCKHLPSEHYLVGPLGQTPPPPRGVACNPNCHSLSHPVVADFPSKTAGAIRLDLG